MKLRELVEVFNPTVEGEKVKIYWQIKEFKNYKFIDSHEDLKKENINQYLLEGDVMNINDITIDETEYENYCGTHSRTDLDIEVLVNLV